MRIVKIHILKDWIPKLSSISGNGTKEFSAYVVPNNIGNLRNNVRNFKEEKLKGIRLCYTRF